MGLKKRRHALSATVASVGPNIAHSSPISSDGFFRAWRSALALGAPWVSGLSLSPLGLSLCPSLLRGVGAARHLHHLALLLLDLLPHELGLLELLHQPEAAERPRGDPQEHEGLDAGVGREPVAACAPAAGQRSAAGSG